MRRVLPLLLAIGAVAAVVLPYLALGGASFEPTPVADPCEAREWRDPGSLDTVLEQVALSALDGAACVLGVSREEFVLALRDEEALDEFVDEHGLSRADAERAVDDGVERALDDAQEAGALPGLTASLVARVLDAVPPWLLLGALDRLSDFLPS